MLWKERDKQSQIVKKGGEKMKRWKEGFRKQLEKYCVGANNDRWGATFYKFWGSGMGNFGE